MTDHTPEPWADYDNDLPKTLSATDYNRARACVNACAGIPTEKLGDGSVKKTVTALKFYADPSIMIGHVIDGKIIGHPDRGDLARAALASFRETKT